MSIAEELGVSRPTVQLWRTRVREQGIGTVWQIAAGRGRKPQYEQAQGHDALELPADGRGARGQQEYGEPLMAATQSQAAPEPHL